jgi:GT2 family glycosyltransferase
MVNNQDIKLSIIIPTYNREEILPQTIDLILKENFPHCELILIHQRPQISGQFQEFLKRTENRIRYFAVNWASVPRACNFGVNKAKGEIILMLDDDIIPGEDLISAHYRNYEDSKVGAVAGRISTPHRVRFPEHAGRIGELGPKHETFVSSRRQDVQTGKGANMSFRRPLFQKLGGFDTSYIKNAHRFESDLCFQIRKMGYRIVYDPKAAVEHLELNTGGIRAWGVTDTPAFYRNEMLFYFKNRPNGWLGRYLWLNYIQRVPSRKVRNVLIRNLAFVLGVLWGSWVYLFRYRFKRVSVDPNRKETESCE